MTHYNDRKIRAALLPLSCLSLIMAGTTPTRAELYFNINALHLSEAEKQAADLSLLSRPDIQMPGTYRVQVTVNRERSSERTLNFVICGSQLCPELTPALLAELGVRADAFPVLAAMDSQAIITDPGEYIPEASVEFNFDRRALSISIPQAAMTPRARGDVSPDKWDDGLPMLFTSYSASGDQSRQAGSGTTRSSYINLRSGANLGAWRLRNYSYYSHSVGTGSTFSSMRTWLERDIRSLRARLMAGETTSPGLVFDSFSFRGLSLSSQEEMLPDSLQGYAPEVRGIAMTSAVVEIRQNGNLLYQTYVSPGEFVIRDLYATGTSGNLDVTIREQDGSVRTFSQPYASPPVSVRQGALKYSLTAGEYGDHTSGATDVIQQRFVQGEVLYGLQNNTSLYGGVTGAEHYYNLSGGVGQGLGEVGALSLDVTHARTTFRDGDIRQGQSWRLRYSKQFEVTGTAMTLAGYRYASDGYYDFSEASAWYNSTMRTARYPLKSRAQVTLSQNAGFLGSVSLSAWQQEYRNQGGKQNRAMTGSWSRSFHGATVSISQSQSKNSGQSRTDNITALSVSLPIGRWLSSSGGSVRMSNRYSHSSTGSDSLTATLSGTALEGNNLSWSVAQSRTSQKDSDTRNSTALSATLRGGQVTTSLGYSDWYGENRRLNWGLRGGIVIHPYGVTLSQPLSEGSGYALIRSPGAGDVRVRNYTGLRTDWRGYAVVPSMAPYRENELSLDTATLGDNVDLTENVQRSVPARESLVLADYRTRVGYRAFLTLTHNGRVLPLGTPVGAGESSSMTNERGEVYLTGVADGANISATLQSGKTCSARFSQAGAVKNNGITMARMECQ